jgi:abhydrolase domain-containing protein 17
MGAVVSTLAFPAPDKSLSERALRKRQSKNQLVYLTTKSGHRIPAVHIVRRDSTSSSSSSPPPPQNNETRLTVLYSHGNAEDVGLTLPYLDYLSHFCDCHVLAYEYCGYSLAEGEPSETNCYECIDAAYKYLTEEKGLSPSQIVLFGRSLGTGPTVDLAAKLCQKIVDNNNNGCSQEGRIAGCVLQSPLESAGRCVFSEITTYVLYPLDIFRNYEKVQHLAPIPVLFMHGMVDRVVPSASGQALYNTWREVADPTTSHADAKDCQPLWVPDAGHNDMPEFQCMQTVNAFLDYLNLVNLQQRDRLS